MCLLVYMNVSACVSKYMCVLSLCMGYSMVPVCWALHNVHFALLVGPTG